MYILWVYILLYFFLAWRSRQVALSLLLFLLPSYVLRFQIGPLPTTLLELMLLVLFAVWMLRDTVFLEFLRGRYSILDFRQAHMKREPYPWRFELSALLIIALAAVFVAGGTSAAFGIWKAYFFEAAMFYILVLNIFQDNYRRVYAPLAWSVVLLSVLSVYQYLSGDLIANPLWSSDIGRRAVGVFGYPNAVGLFVGPLSLLFLSRFVALWQTGKRNQSVLFGLAFVASFLAVYAAKSDGALLAMLASISLWTLFACKRRLVLVGLGLVVTLVLLAIPNSRYYLWEKLSLGDFSGQVRRLQWSETWDMLRDDRLIFGSGLSNYRASVEAYHQPGFFYNFEGDPDFRRKIVIFDENYKAKHWQPLEIYMYPHNIILNFWTELGFLGVILFAWAIIKYLYIVAREQIRSSGADRLELLGLGAAMLVIVIHGLVDVPYFKNDLAFIFWLLPAMLSLSIMQRRKQYDQEKRTS